MGMYTELVMGVDLERDCPQQVIDVLGYMVGTVEAKPAVLPDHRLFATGRWEIMLLCDSYYFDGDTHATFRFDDISRSWSLTIRSNFKNYDDEVSAFIDWLTPHLATTGFAGYWRYEEHDDPTLIYIEDES